MNDNSKKNDTLSSFDEEAFLAGVDALAEECGDWRRHITASAAADPRWPDVVGPELTEHISRCNYCQELIETFGWRHKTRICRKE